MVIYVCAPLISDEMFRFYKWWVIANFIVLLHDPTAIASV